MVLFKNCSFEYSKKEKVIDNFSFKFEDKGIYALVGKSGSGKTTILNLIAGIIKPSDGSILYSNEINNITSSISYIFQNDNLFGNLTVLENINIFVGITQKNIALDEIDNVLVKLGIKEYKNKKVSDISGGERQRVSIAIALLKKSKVILADEPCASLDSETSKEIMDIFKELSKEKLIIISSHNLEIVKEYCLNIIEFPLKTNYIIDDSSIGFKTIKNEGHSLSFNNIIKTYFKVFGHKISLCILSFIMFTIVISLCIFSLSVAGINEEKIMVNKIVNDDITDVFVSGETNYLPEHVTQEGLKYLNDNWNVYIFGGVDKEISDYYDINAIKKVVLDDSLDDYVIQMTDYSLYNLRFYDAINFNQPSEMIGKKIKVNFYGKELFLDLGSIIETKAGNKIKNKESFSYYMDSSKMNGVYSYLKINSKTYFDICELSPSNTNYDIQYVDGIECSLVDYDDNLENNEITISSHLLNQIENIQNKKYSIGDKIVLTLTSTKNVSSVQTFIIKNIIDLIYDTLSISSDVNTYDFRFNLSSVKNAKNYYFKTSDIDIDEVVHLIYANNSLSIHFHEDSIIDYFSQDLTYFKNVSSISIVITSILLMALLSYSFISMYNLNKKYYLLLFLYGMKKTNSLIFMMFDVLPSLIISLIVGNIIGRKICVLFDQMVLPKTSLNIINSFNLYISLSTSFIILALTFIFIILFYLILINKKNKSYIGL